MLRPMTHIIAAGIRSCNPLYLPQSSKLLKTVPDLSRAWIESSSLHWLRAPAALPRRDEPLLDSGSAVRPAPGGDAEGRAPMKGARPLL